MLAILFMTRRFRHAEARPRRHTAPIRAVKHVLYVFEKSSHPCIPELRLSLRVGLICRLSPTIKKEFALQLEILHVIRRLRKVHNPSVSVAVNKPIAVYRENMSFVQPIVLSENQDGHRGNGFGHQLVDSHSRVAFINPGMEVQVFESF
jgi:hypothetical protein